MAKKTPAATDNAQDSAQKQSEAAIAPQAESAPQAASTLPFAQKRDELIKKFRANAVPREADYKQLLDQHYDVAGALGMANSDDNNGGKTGNGLVFENSKLHVKAKATGGLISDTNGVSLVAGPTLVIGTDNKVNVKINQKNGLKISGDGEVAVNLFSNNVDSDIDTAAVIGNNLAGTSGLWVNVGTAGDKKGLKQYQGTSSRAVLGVSHDTTLKIDSSTGKLGVSTYGAIPKGTIVMFSGKPIPEGWHICDGTVIGGVTLPNLVDRFIRGGTTTSVNNTGGADSQSFTPQGTVTVAPHQLNVSEIPSHSHNIQITTIKDNEQGWNNYSIQHLGKRNGSDSVSIAASCEIIGGNQSHIHNASFSGSSGKVTVTPAYYTLIFIIKL